MSFSLIFIFSMLVKRLVSLDLIPDLSLYLHYIPLSPNEKEYITLATHMQTLHNTTESQRDNQHRSKQLLSVTLFSKVYVNILYLVCWFATRCAGKNTSIFCTQFSPENHRCIAYTGVIVSPKVCVYIVAFCCFTIKDVS